MASGSYSFFISFWLWVSIARFHMRSLFAGVGILYVVPSCWNCFTKSKLIFIIKSRLTILDSRVYSSIDNNKKSYYYYYYFFLNKGRITSLILLILDDIFYLLSSYWFILIYWVIKLGWWPTGRVSSRY